jgi:hypothetical protein
VKPDVELTLKAWLVEAGVAVLELAVRVGVVSAAVEGD